jgi:uncharacterized protein (TIGR02598 family)
MLWYYIYKQVIFFMISHLNSKNSDPRNGFSLVEVAMSLAIMAFTCVSLMGLIPFGLTSFHQAMGSTIEADIVQDLTNDMLLANFSDLYQYSYANSTTTANQAYYYNNEGSPLTVTTPGVVPAGTVYTAVVSISPVSSGGSSATSNSPAGLTANGISKAAPSDPTWATEFSNGLTSAYKITITVASSPSTASYTPNSYPSMAAYLSAYATTASEKAATTHPPDQYSLVIANNNQ